MNVETCLLKEKAFKKKKNKLTCQAKIEMIAMENAALMEIKMNTPSKHPISERYFLPSSE